MVVLQFLRRRSSRSMPPPLFLSLPCLLSQASLITLLEISFCLLPSPQPSYTHTHIVSLIDPILRFSDTIIMPPLFPLLLVLIISTTTATTIAITTTTTTNNNNNNSSKPSPSPTPSSTPSSTPNFLSLMSKNNCKLFSSLLSSTSDAISTFQSNIPSGLTVFCPSDSSLSPFLPHFKNLSSDSKLSLLLFHAIPIYNSLQTLRSSNGVVNTLATDGANSNFNFTVQNNADAVTLKTPIDTALILATLLDKDPLAVFKIDKVLQPIELFKPVEAPAPAPSPVAEPPETGKKKEKKKHAHNSPPAPPGPESAPEPSAENEKAADENLAFQGCCFVWRGLVLPLLLVALLL